MKWTTAYTPKRKLENQTQVNDHCQPSGLRMKVVLTPDLTIILILNMWTRHKPRFSVSVACEGLGHQGHLNNFPLLAIACHHCLRERWKSLPEAKILIKEGNRMRKPPQSLQCRSNKWNERNENRMQQAPPQTEVKYLWLFFNIPLKQVVNHGLHYLIAFKRL